MPWSFGRGAFIWHSPEDPANLGVLDGRLIEVAMQLPRAPSLEGDTIYILYI